MDGIGPDQLYVKELLQRIGQGKIKEVIMATNPTVEGEATACLLYTSKAPDSWPYLKRAGQVARPLPPKRVYTMKTRRKLSMRGSAGFTRLRILSLPL